MAGNFNVVMTGKIADGYDEKQVKENVGKLFKLEETQVDKLFSGKSVILKRAIDRPQAMKIRNALAKAGALALIKQDSGAQTPPSDAPTVAKATAPKSEAATPVQKKPASAKPVAPEPVKSEPKPAKKAASARAVLDVTPAPKPEPVAAKAKSKSPAPPPVSGEFEIVTCPRCGHEQAIADTCGLCNMDLQLHLQRLTKRGGRRRRRR